MEIWPYIATANRACSLLYSFIKEHAGGVWLLPVNVCPDVPLTFCLAKVPFQFVDINPETLCIDIDVVEHILHQSPSEYKGVLFVRTYGALKDTSCEFEQIKSINKDILIIDDRCLCVPEKNPQFWGADMLLYSTGHCKQIDLGGGGLAFYKEDTKFVIDNMLLYDGTDEEALYKQAFSLEEPFTNIPQGWLEMDSYLSADEYFAKIESHISDRIKQREAINIIYSSRLPLSIQLDNEYQSWRFNIRVDAPLKEQVLENLFKNGLFASNHYHSANRLFDNRRFPVSDSLYASVINLFNDKYYSTEKALETCNVINRVICGS